MSDAARDTNQVMISFHCDKGVATMIDEYRHIRRLSSKRVAYESLLKTGLAAEGFNDEATPA